VLQPVSVTVNDDVSRTGENKGGSAGRTVRLAEIISRLTRERTGYLTNAVTCI